MSYSYKWECQKNRGYIIASIFAKLHVVYFSNGFVEVSAAGIGNKSTCPGFGSLIMDGKYPF
ncbi:MAG TPA: hypothetical protein VFN95_12835, partial [Flavitalea sp.]|nr:hypothetical protein [Flavitalea sp.]